MCIQHFAFRNSASIYCCDKISNKYLKKAISIYFAVAVLEVSVCGPWTYCLEECVVEEAAHIMGARKTGEKQNFPSNGWSLGPTSSY